MYYNDEDENNQRKYGYVRVYHTVVDAPAVDVYANGQLLAKNLSYSMMTEYFMVEERLYHISVYPSGTKDTPVTEAMLMVKDGSYVTVVASGELKSIILLGVKDANVPMPKEKAMVRFCHLAPNAPAVDICLADGTTIFENVAFQEITPYLAVNEDEYDLLVCIAGTNQVVLKVPEVMLAQNQYHTIYAIGLVGEGPKLEANLAVDGGMQ